jgi:hypothetical protein
MISSADAQTAIHAAPARRPAITSLAKCTPRYKRLNAMTTHQQTVRLAGRGLLLAVELYDHVYGCRNCGEKTND